LAISSRAVETFRSASRVSTGMGWDCYFFLEIEEVEVEVEEEKRNIAGGSGSEWI